MAEKKSGGAKRSSTRKTGTTRKRKTTRKKKSQVKLSMRAVFVLAITICVLCASFLAFSFFVLSTDSNPSEKTPAVASVSKTENKKTETKKTEASKTSQQKTSSQKTEAVKTEVKVSQQKITEQKTAVQKTEPYKTESQKTETKTSAQKTEAPKTNASTQKTESSAKTSSTSPVKKEEQVASVTPVTGGDKDKIEEAKKHELKFDIPPAVNGAKLCFVIDDAGLSVSNVKRYTSLPFPITIAVLPRLSHSKDCAYVVRQSGKELILHQPMQAHTYPSGTVPNPGPGAILPDMTTSEIAATIKYNLDEIGPNVKGMNNHEGSLITENAIKIGAVLEVASERGIYFLDSRTTAQTAVPSATLERDMNYLARFAPFLDNTVDRNAMLTELYKGLKVANKNGYAVIIGHVDKSVNILPVLLSDIYPYLVKAGYEITTPSKLGL